MFVALRVSTAMSCANHGPESIGPWITKVDFMVIEARRNLVVLGERFDASLDDIDLFFRSREAS